MTSETSGIEGEPLDLANPALAAKSKQWAKQLTVIAGDNDRWLPRGVGIYKEPLKTEPVIFPGAGHFSLDDGWGQWPGLLKWIESAEPKDLLIR
jgi:pimeloyl-ACP methyl ester carboxylesterase